MKKSKMISLLGFAAKARKIISGSTACEYNIQKNNIKLIILTEDLSQNTKEKFSTLCEKKSIPFRVYGNIDTLSKTTGNSGRGVFGITDKNFADAMIKEIENEKVILSM